MWVRWRSYMTTCIIHSYEHAIQHHLAIRLHDKEVAYALSVTREPDTEGFLTALIKSTCSRFLYFQIVQYPIDIYDVYSRFKNVLFQLSTSDVKSVHFHLVVTFNDDAILKSAEVLQHCDNIKQLLDGKSMIFFEKIDFTFAAVLVYNPFSETRFSPMCCINSIQSIVNEATLSENSTSDFSNELMVSGTDVSILSNHLVSACLSSDQSKLSGMQIEPIPSPKHVSTLLTELDLDQAHRNQHKPDPYYVDEMNLFFHENINSQSTISLIDSMKKFIQHDKNKIQHVV